MVAVKPLAMQVLPLGGREEEGAGECACEQEGTFTAECVTIGRPEECAVGSGNGREVFLSRLLQKQLAELDRVYAALEGQESENVMRGDEEESEGGRGERRGEEK